MVTERITDHQPAAKMGASSRSPLLRWLLLALALVSLAAQFPRATYTFTSESRLWIEGTSSLHDWTCDVNTLEGSVQANFTGTVQLTGTVVSVPVQAIECHKGKMNRKTYEALRADDHPTITYTLDTARLSPSGDGGYAAHTTGRLTVAGTERTVEMHVTGQVLEAGGVRFSGRLPLKMSDFGIDPPTALLGTLKTGNDVTVGFDVVLTR